MKKFLIVTMLAVLTSCYYFSFSFRFLPVSINSKLIMAAFGVVIFGIECIQNHTIMVPRRITVSGLIAVIFSVWCLFCITENGTNDTTYSDYWTSFFTWMFGAYCLIVIMRQFHDKVDLALITRYLAIVGVAQCIIALLIDNIVYQFFNLGQEYNESAGRLYGIGCALDPAGVRFSVILILLAHQIAANPSVSKNKKSLAMYLIAFTIITVVGSIISRTTTVGTGLGLFYIAISYANIQRGGYISKRQLRLYGVFLSVVVLAVFVGTYLYNTNADAREYFRFGFEGFFNLAETGEFQTNSTDILSNMWIWPTDTRGWIIGYGRYGVFEWGSDIGYCLFTLYCGLVGLAIFSIYFIYNHLSIRKKFRNGFMLALLLIATTFIVWIKIATDIFLIDALLFIIEGDAFLDEESPDALEANDDVA